MDFDPQTRRMLVVDDIEQLHEDFRKSLRAPQSACGSEEDPFEDVDRAMPTFEIISAHQGEEAVEFVTSEGRHGRFLDGAFVDMRMPPGADGLATVEALWRVDPHLHAVICTAFSDYGYDEIRERVARPERLLILKKPFDLVEVRQAAAMCSESTRIARRTASLLSALDVQAGAMEELLDESPGSSSPLCGALHALQATLHEARSLGEDGDGR